jgi:hypothetical protein
VNNNDPCNDHNACTTDDACKAGTCVGGPPLDCNDNNICTDDGCDTASGCTHANNTDPCTDNNPCTTPDMCSGGQCVGGPAANCDDNDVCTTDTCDQAVPGGCVHTNNTNPCTDDDPCTQNDTCANDQCVGQPRDCSDTNECTVDRCDNQGGGFLCVHDNCIDVPGSNCPPQCIPPNCGNGQIDPGETCDPPGSPQPPNGNLCRDDCTFCGDMHVDTVDGETCDDGNSAECNPAHPQQALDECKNNCTLNVCEDPAKIRFASDVDRLDVHGRLARDATVDFSSKTFVVQLTDSANQVVYRGSLDAGVILGDPVIGRFAFVDWDAKLNGGIAKLKIGRKAGTYQIKLRAYGNLYNAEANMVTHFFAQDDEWTVACVWERRPHGWRCKGLFGVN